MSGERFKFVTWVENRPESTSDPPMMPSSFLTDLEIATAFSRGRKAAENNSISSGLEITDTSQRVSKRLNTSLLPKLCAVLNEIRGNLLDSIFLSLNDGLDGCAVSPPVAAWSCTRILITEAKWIRSELINDGNEKLLHGVVK